MDALDDAFNDLRFALIAIEEARRTLIIRPEHEDYARRVVADLGISGVITINVNTHLPAGVWYLVDEQAMEAQVREYLQRPIKFDFGG